MTGAVFIDLKKAFDNVPHDDLLKKLYRYGIQDLPLSWFEGYLSNRTQSVSIENHLSSAANIISVMFKSISAEVDKAERFYLSPIQYQH